MTADVDDRAPGEDLEVARARRLVEQAAAGNHEAWEQIYRSVYPRLWAYAAHHVGRDAADDVVSETMTRAVTGIAGFRWTPAGLEPWLFGIARRIAADHHRRAGRRKRWSRAVAAPAATLPADVAETADEHAAVRAAFNRLSDQRPRGARTPSDRRNVAGTDRRRARPTPRGDPHRPVAGAGPSPQAIGSAMTDEQLLERLTAATHPRWSHRLRHRQHRCRFCIGRSTPPRPPAPRRRRAGGGRVPSRSLSRRRSRQPASPS